MEVSAVIAVVLSVIAGLTATASVVRQRRTEDAALVVGAQRDHMRLLTDENKDLRERLRLAESNLVSANQQIADLRVQVAHCDADKNQMRVRFEAETAQLRTELDALKRRVNGL